MNHRSSGAESVRAISAPSPAQGPGASRREPVGASEHRPNSPEKQGRKDTQMVSHEAAETAINEQEERDFVRAVLVPIAQDEESTQWRWGDALVKRIHGNAGRSAFGRGHSNGATREIAVYSRLLAEEGFERAERTLRDYYQTAQAFSPDTRIYNAEWIAYLVAGNPTRMAKAAGIIGEGRMTKRAVQEALNLSVNGQVGEPGAKAYIEAHPEVVVEAIAANPEIAKAVAANPDAHLAVERERNMAATPRAPKAKDEPPMGLPELLLIGVIAADAQKVVTALTAVNTEGRAFTDEARTIVNGYADEAIALLQNAKAIVNGEVRTHLTDADFDALLTGGER